MVTGETFSMLRDQYLQDFANGSLRWLVNCDVLTTGFDAPCIDCIAILRATMSPGLFAQIVGRGLRTHPSKSDCLILDFGENIARHGSLDDRNYGRAAVVQRAGKTKAEPSEVNGRGKECPNCGIDVAVNVRACPGCNFFFPVSHSAQADHDSKLTGAPPVPDPEEWTVEGVGWSLWNKKGDPEAPPTLRVDYKCRPVEGSRLKRFQNGCAFSIRALRERRLKHGGRIE